MDSKLLLSVIGNFEITWVVHSGSMYLSQCSFCKVVILCHWAPEILYMSCRHVRHLQNVYRMPGDHWADPIAKPCAWIQRKYWTELYNNLNISYKFGHNTRLETTNLAWPVLSLLLIFCNRSMIQQAIHMYVCLYVCMYVCMYVCVCVCVCVCV